MKKFGKYILYSIALLVIIVGSARWRVTSLSDGLIFGKSEMLQIEECQNVILLGAKIKFDGTMSPILKERAMAVLDLYESGKVCKIIISGSREEGIDYIYDEVTPVKKFFIKQKIPETIISSDYKGNDTFTSLKNMRDEFQINKDVIIVTQKFHLPRAVYIAQMLDIRASGFVAYKFPYPTKSGMYKDIIREWPASVKAVWQTEINN